MRVDWGNINGSESNGDYFTHFEVAELKFNFESRIFKWGRRTFLSPILILIQSFEGTDP